MLVVDHNTIFVNWNLGDVVHPMDYSGDVVVVFDPSKTNMAMVVGTPDNVILNAIEFSGNNRGRGPVMDTTRYCEEVRNFLSIYLSKVKLYLVGVEQAITKRGLQYHHSSMVLNEIRGILLNFFPEKFNIRVVEVNNWSWKFGVLPDGYRSKYEKGSKKWFKQCMPNSPYSNYFEADMTDCICIYWYLIKKNCANYSCYCNQYEQGTSDYIDYYVPLENSITNDMREVTFNPRFTVEDNINFYVNRIIGFFFMVVDVDKLNVPDMYGKSAGFQEKDLNCLKVKVVAKRK